MVPELPNLAAAVYCAEGNDATVLLQITAVVTAPLRDAEESAGLE
jgi:hypothetical protein